MKSNVKPAKKKATPTKLGDARFSMIIKPFGNVPHPKQVQFGGVTVIVPKPSAGEVKKQINESKKVASRLTKVVSAPGVKLKVQADTPIFTADPHDPTLVVRKLGGSTTRGRFANGKFVEIA